MAIPITEHPGYGEAMAQYQAAKQAAAEEGDPTKQQQVELQWANAKSKMQDEMFDRQQAEQARQAAITQAKAMVDIPDAVLASLQTPDQIMQAATALKEQRDAQQPAPAAAAPAPAASWGNSPPTSAASAPQDPNDPRAYQAHMKELAQEVETNVGRRAAAQEEFGKEYFNNHIAPAIMRPEAYERATGIKPQRVPEEIARERR